MSKWHSRWMSMAVLCASWSKDRSRKVGAVIVDDHQRVVSLGWNGFPRGIDDDVESRHTRPAKYLYTEHAERQCMYNAAANGAAVRGCTLYCTLFPCADCARAIIQSGITKVYTVMPNWDDSTYGQSFKAASEMLAEAGIEVLSVEGFTQESTKQADTPAGWLIVYYPPDSASAELIDGVTCTRFDINSCLNYRVEFSEGRVVRGRVSYDTSSPQRLIVVTEQKEIYNLDVGDVIHPEFTETKTCKKGTCNCEQNRLSAL